MVRLLAASAAVGGTGTPITPGGISTSGITIPPMAGSPRACRRRCRNFSHTRNGQCPWNYWACWDCKSGGSTSSGLAPAPAVPPLPAEPVSIFMAFCPEQPNGPRPNTPLPIPTPCQCVGIVTRDAGTGVQRTLSPTAYRPEQTSGITSIWAPQGLGMIRDGNSQFSRIYWEREDSGHRLLRVEGSPSASFGWNPWCIFFSEFLATCAVERIVGNWYSNLWPARGSLLFSMYSLPSLQISVLSRKGERESGSWKGARGCISAT